MIEAVDADAEAYLAFRIPQKEAYIFLFCFTQKYSFQLSVAFGLQLSRISMESGGIMQTAE